VSRRQRVVLVNSFKVEPITLLEADPAVDLIAITEPRFAARYGPDTDVRVVDDIRDLTAVREVVLDAARGSGVDRVVAASERSLQTGGYLRSFFGLDGIDYDTANAFSNKHVMKQRLRAAGIAVAPSRLAPGVEDIAAAAADLDWPVIVKPVLGAGSLDVVRLDTPAALTEFLNSPAAGELRGCEVPLLVEHCVDMRAEYHCDGVIQDGQVRFVEVSRYFEPLLGVLGRINGSATLTGADPARARAAELHARTVAALGLRSGVTHLELFETGDGMLVGEITCRPAGGGLPRNVELASGVNLWRCFLDTELGRDPVITTVRSPLVHMVCDLPIARGRVVDISSAQELAAIPDVVEMALFTRPGDVISEQLNSASRTGSLLLALDGDDLVAERLTAVEATYRIEVDPLLEVPR
jgi:hypothetical protein